VKKGQNGRKSLRRLKSTVGCNASKRRRSNNVLHDSVVIKMTVARFVDYRKFLNYISLRLHEIYIWQIKEVT